MKEDQWGLIGHGNWVLFWVSWEATRDFDQRNDVIWMTSNILAAVVQIDWRDTRVEAESPVRELMQQIQVKDDGGLEGPRELAVEVAGSDQILDTFWRWSQQYVLRSQM